jgi:iron complex transport system substrate-binding protein
MRIVYLLLLTLSLFGSERIVTLSPAIAEIVSGLGETRDIVGVSDYTLYPETLSLRPKVGGYTTLSLERTLALKPTLVIGLEHQKTFLSKLEHFGIRTKALQLESTQEIKSSIFQLGELLQHPQEARGLIEAIDYAKENAPRNEDNASVLIVFASSSSLSRGVYVAGHDLFFEEILESCGTHNAYSDDFYAQPVLTPEGIIAADPDRVLLLLGPLDKVDPMAVKKRWMALPIKAAKERKITVIQNDYILIPSQRIAKSITTICEILR